MFKLLNLKWKRELEELKSLHRIELAEKDAEAQRKIRENEVASNHALSRRTEDLHRLEQKLRSDHELKLRETTTLLKLASEQKTAQLELDHEKKLQAVKAEAAQKLVEQREELLRSHYEKLASAMAKLHEEGNVTTKFMQDIALKMFDKGPTERREMTLITGEVCPKKK